MWKKTKDLHDISRKNLRFFLFIKIYNINSKILIKNSHIITLIALN